MVHHLIKHASSATRQPFQTSKDSPSRPEKIQAPWPLKVDREDFAQFLVASPPYDRIVWMCDEVSAGWGWPEEDEEIQKQRKIEKV